MRTFLFTVMTLFLLLFTISALSQTPAAAPAKLPAFEIGLGLGQLATATAGNLEQSQVRFEANLNAGFRWFPAERFAVGLGVTRDTVKLSTWLVKHNFREPSALIAYEYTGVDLSGYYYPIRNAHGDLYVGIDVTAYFAPGDSASGTKIGYGCTFGGDYALGKGFAVGAYVRYRHVQDFLVPIANVVEPGVRVSFKF
jgi:opacity protein-like surface antigen